MAKILKHLVWIAMQVVSAWLVVSAIVLVFLGFTELEATTAAPENENTLRETSFWASIAVFWMIPWVAPFVAIVSAVSWVPALFFRSARPSIHRIAFVSLFTCIGAAWIGIPLALSNSPLHMNELPPSAIEILSGSGLGAIVGFVFAVGTDWMSNRLALLLPAKFKY